MNLSNCEIIPSVIYDTNDPLKLGRIKCVIPGFIDNSTMSLENMPWVRPFAMDAHQSFSKPVKGFKVWVIVNKANYNEYWYLPFFEYNDITKQYLNEVYDDQPEVIISHNNGGNHTMFTYDDKNGYNQKLGQHHIEVHPNGHISILGGTAEIDMNSDISIGEKGGEYIDAAKAEPLMTMLNNLRARFNDLAEKSSSDWKTSILSDLFAKCAEALNDVDKINAEHVKIN